jgi:hypothetical protein
MAYTSGTLSEIIHSIGGRGKYWSYITGDSQAAVCAPGYISDAGKKRLMLGDVIFVMSGTLTTLVTASPSLAPAGDVSEFANTSVPAFQVYQVSAISAFDAKGIPTQTATATMSPCVLAGMGDNPRNLLDGGDFTTNPWQLGTSFNGNGPTPKLTADRFAVNSGTSLVWTAGRASNTNVQGFSAAYQWGRSAGDTHTVGLSYGQVLESVDSIRLQGLPVSLSWWNVADANFTAGASGGFYTASILAGTGTDDTFGNMVSGAWTGASTVATQTYTPGSTISRIGPLNGVVPTNATQIGVVWSYVASAGTTAGTHESMQFMGMQLEVGPMTPFEHLDVAEVVNICTRYLQVISEPTAGMAIGPASFSASSIAQVHIPLPSPLRKAPTVTFNTGGWAISDSALGLHRISAGGLQIGNTGAITMLVTCAATLTAGLVSFMQGQSTGLGNIQLDSDYA